MKHSYKWQKMLILIGGILIFTVIGSKLFILEKFVSHPRKCKFDIRITKTYYMPAFMNYGNYYSFEGTIKILGPRSEFLNAVIIKLYDKDNILVAEGHENIDKDILPDTGIQFATEVKIQPKSDKTKYDLNELRQDVYPSFLTCK